MYDVVIIGGGVIGCFIARELSPYRIKVCLAEKEPDVACATSKANSAIIHAGYDAKPGTLKAKLNVEGNSAYTQVCRELDIPFKRTGSIVVAFSEEETKSLSDLYQRGVKNGVPGMKIINREELRQLEPNISQQAVAALYAETAGIICPFTTVIAAAENACTNGVEFLLGAEVTSIDAAEENHFLVNTVNGTLETRYVVNAAGVFADKINDMAGGEHYSLKPRRGEYCILDKDQGYLANTVIFQIPTKMGKGILVTPTVDGNLLIGPNAEDINDKEDFCTTAEGLRQVMEGAKKSVPGIQISKIITSFTGLRAVPEGEDFIIATSGRVKGFVNAAGIESPGFTSAPAVARMVREILEEEGLKCEMKADYNPYRQPFIRFRELSPAGQGELIEKNPDYGRIICRCETITEGEIVDAIRRPLGARTLDGIKRRVRAGAGRCQGGFCSPRVMEILSRELKITLNHVVKHREESRILMGYTKSPELLKEEDGYGTV